MSHVLNYVEAHSFQSIFVSALRVFVLIINEWWIFAKCFSCINWYDHMHVSFILLMWCIRITDYQAYWTTLEFLLTRGDNLWKILLDSVQQHFIENSVTMLITILLCGFWFYCVYVWFWDQHNLHSKIGKILLLNYFWK